MSIDERELKVLEYLEGELTPEEEQEFLRQAATDPNLQAMLAEYQQQDRLLHRYFDAQEEVLAHGRRPNLATLPAGAQVAEVTRPRRAPVWIAAAAAACLLVATGVYLQRGAPGESGIASVIHSEGTLQGFAGKDSAPTTLAVGPVRQISRVKTAASGTAELALTGGAGRLELAGATRATVTAGAEGHDVAVERGAVLLHAQPGDHPVRVATPHLSLTATEPATVAVTRGLRGSEVAVLDGSVELNLPGAGRKRLARGTAFSSTGVKPQPLDAQVAWSRHGEALILALPEDLRPAPPALEVAMAPDAAPTTFMKSEPVDAHLAPGAATLTTTAGAFTTGFLPADSFALLETTRISSLLEGTGQQTFGAVLRDPVAMRLLDDMIGTIPASGNQAGVQLLAERLRELAANPELQTVLDSMDGAASLGIGPAGPVLIADVTRNEQEVARIIAEVDAWSAAEWGDDDRPRLSVVGGQLVVSLDPAAMEATRAALETWTPTGFGTAPFATEVHRDTRGSRLVVALDGRSFAARFRDGYQHANAANQFLERFGLGNIQAVIAAETFADEASNQGMRVTFDGERTGALSWLGAPGPLNAFQFFSPDAHVVMASRIQQPAVILDQVFGWIAADNPGMPVPTSEPEIALLHRIASTLGNEIAVGLDNPVLPIPNVKVAIEVIDPIEFHTMTVELLGLMWDRQAPGQGGVEVTTSEHRNHMIVDLKYPGSKWGFSYAVVDDYVLLGPGRPFLQQTIDIFVEGRSLDNEQAFINALPAKSGTQCSALFYATVNGSVGEAAPYLQQILAAKGIPIPMSLFTHRPTQGSTAAVYYAVAHGERIDLFAEGVKGSYKAAGMVSSVMSWLGKP